MPCALPCMLEFFEENERSGFNRGAVSRREASALRALYEF
jgi:hypothetical protein